MKAEKEMHSSHLKFKKEGTPAVFSFTDEFNQKLNYSEKKNINNMTVFSN